MMNLREAMEARHSVRAYTDEPVDPDALDTLQADIEAWNAEGKLHFQMGVGLDDAFLGLKTHYGRFKDVHNAIALIGSEASVAQEVRVAELRARKAKAAETAETSEAGANATESAVSLPEALLEQKVGYYGEHLALRIVQLGLDCSWSVLDGADAAADPWWKLDEGESVVWVIAFGHGARPGGRRRTKPIEELASVPGDDFAAAPEWFVNGMEAAMSAPTSLSQQPFHFTLQEDGSVKAEALEGLFANVGLGCAKCHFEIGAAPHSVVWSA